MLTFIRRLVVWALVLLTSAQALPGHHYTILISFDGFRHDYLERLPDGPFKSLVATGCRAKHLVPVNPTKTFPNHWAIATGCWPAQNGILDNRFFDRALNDTFGMSRTEPMWWLSEPVWITAERQNKRAFTYFWPGSQTPIGGLLPSRSIPYSPSRDYRARIDSILAWTTLPEPPSLIVSFFEVRDDVGHRYGPDAPEIDQALLTADSIVGALVGGLEVRGIRDSTAVVIVSDHGMTSILPPQPEDVRFDLALLGDTAKLVVIESNPNMLVYGYTQEQARMVAQRINSSGIRAKATATVDLDSTWHLGSGNRTPDLYIQASMGYDLYTSRSQWKPGSGNHGYHNSNPDMHGIFVAAGRSIQPGVIAELNAVDVYNIVCRLVGVMPGSNNGNGSRIKDVIR